MGALGIFLSGVGAKEKDFIDGSAFKVRQVGEGGKLEGKLWIEEHEDRKRSTSSIGKWADALY